MLQRPPREPTATPAAPCYEAGLLSCQKGQLQAEGFRLTKNQLIALSFMLFCNSFPVLLLARLSAEDISNECKQVLIKKYIYISKSLCIA